LSATLEGPGAAQTTTFALAHPAPNTELLAIVEGILQAVVADHAPPAHLFGLTGGRSTFWKEEVGVDAHAVGACLPASIF
jgi:hypothetical protein